MPPSLEKLARIEPPQPDNAMVIVTVVLAEYPVDAPLLPAIEKLPQLLAVVVVVVETVGRGRRRAAGRRGAAARTQ